MICANEALDSDCSAVRSDTNTGPWGTYHGWEGNKTSTIAGRNVCVNNFGITNYQCDFTHWSDPAVWLKLWVK